MLYNNKDPQCTRYAYEEAEQDTKFLLNYPHEKWPSFQGIIFKNYCSTIYNLSRPSEKSPNSGKVKIKIHVGVQTVKISTSSVYISSLQRAYVS